MLGLSLSYICLISPQRLQDFLVAAAAPLFSAVLQYPVQWGDLSFSDPSWKYVPPESVEAGGAVDWIFDCRECEVS